MLPKCTPTLNKHNIDVLGLRSSPKPGIPYTGTPGGPDDPALLVDSWRWVTLVAELGTVERAKVCAGLQSGAGAEGLYIDNMRLSSKTTPMNTTPCAAIQITNFDGLASCRPPTKPSANGTWLQSNILEILGVAVI